MKKLFTLFAFAVTAASVAQPVFQYSNSPAPGVSGTVYVAPIPTSPGPAGAGVTWNFSTLTFTPVGTASIVPVASTPFASSFSTCNFAVMIATSTATIYGYNNIQPTINEQIGNNITATGGSTYTPNPKTELIYPFNYGNVISDTYQCVSCSPGSMTRTYDGYGTLIVNGKTINNVARVTSYFGGSSYYYNFYVTTPIIASVFNYDATGTTSSFFDIPSVTGIEEETTPFSALNLFPNPASHTIRFNNANLVEVKAQITDMFGAVVKDNMELPALSENSIDISGLAKGLYFVNCRDAKGHTSVSKIVVE